MDRVATLITIINNTVPLIFSGFFYHSYNKLRRNFYQSWSLGFLLYGISNFIDTYLTLYPRNSLIMQTGMISSLLAFTCILTGIGQLVRKTRLMLLLSLSVPGLTMLLLVLGYPIEMVENLTSLLYLLITLTLYYIRLKFKLDLEIVDLGWLVILIANIGYIYGQISLFMTDVFCLLGKTIVFLWMTQPRFVSFTEQIEHFVGSGIPYSDRDLGSITIIESSASKTRDLDWLTQKLGDETLRNARKILVITSDLLSDIELSESGLLDIPDIIILKMTASKESSTSDRILHVNDNLNALHVSMAEILESVKEKKVQTCFTIYNLSTLIHTNGWRRIYSLLISQIPKLKEANIITQIVISPSSHENTHEIKKITLLANRILKIPPN